MRFSPNMGRSPRGERRARQSMANRARPVISKARQRSVLRGGDVQVVLSSEVGLACLWMRASGCYKDGIYKGEPEEWAS